ncbi:MAG: fibronectin type III domain-containing protein [Clostridia bacterium]|nr:fibronectin type III domain-containing protein [Clostridia bacterium]
MKKSLFTKSALFFMTVVSFIILMTVRASAAEEKVYCYKYSVPALEATYNYLDDFYLKEHPEFSLAFHYGSPSDQRVITEKAIEITKECKTDAEKAMTIAKWVKNNITYYDKSINQFPIDVYVNKEADCLGTAYLMSDMMRSVGISTAPVLAYVGNMKTAFDESFILEKKWPGHAFVFAYIDSQWLLYDPLYLRYAISDSDVISEWYFITGIEGVMPYYEEMNNEIIDYVVLYKNGKLYRHEFANILNMQYIFISHGYAENSPWFKLGSAEKVKNLEPGECYSDGWYGHYASAYIGDPYDGKWVHVSSGFNYKMVNGVQLNNVLTKRGDTYYRNSMKLINDIDECFLKYGNVVVYDGEYLPFEFDTDEPLPEKYQSDMTFREKGFTVRYSISDAYSDMASIDENRKLTIKKEGSFGVNIQLLSPDGGRIMDGSVFLYGTKSDSCCACEYNRHVYRTLSRIEPDCTNDGSALKECVGCGKQRTSVLKKTGHETEKVKGYSGTCIEPGLTDGRRCITCGEMAVKQEVIKPVGKHTFDNYEICEPTCTEKGKKTYYCSCGYSYSEDVKPTGHQYYWYEADYATCTKEGTKTYICSCGHQYTEQLPKLSHNTEIIPAVPATYKSSGLTEGERCIDCGAVTVKQKKVKRLTLKKVKSLKAKSIKVSDSSYVKLQWKSVKGAEKYEVYRYVNKKWKKIKTVTSTAYTVKKLTAGKTYKFKVRAVAGDNKGDFSSVYTAKMIPSKTSVTLKAEKNQLTIRWKTVSDVKGYQLMYSTSEKFTKKATKTLTVTKAKTKKTTIKNLKKGKKYYVKVRAYKTVGTKKIYGAFSSVKTVKIR